MKERTEAVVTRVKRRGRIVRSRELQRDGVSKHDIAAAVAAGMLVRERRVWVALPDADPLLRFAAREGVVLSCITQAKRHQLWVPEQDGIHVACHPHAGMVKAPQAVIHRHTPLVARDPNVLVDPIVNVLQAVAMCQPYEHALAIWDSAPNKGLVDKPMLQRLAFHGAARALCQDSSPFHDSGLETFVPQRLRWLRLPIHPQTWLLGRRVDFLIGDRLVLQIDGGHHVGRQRSADNAHDAELMLHGYHVIRVTYDQVVSHWPEVQDLILAAIAQGLHLAA